MCGLLASLGITAWIVTGAQMAIYNNELKFSEKNVSIAGCPANTIFKNHTDYSGYVIIFLFHLPNSFLCLALVAIVISNILFKFFN